MVDLENIQVRSLDGNTKLIWKPKRVQLGITTKIGIDTDKNRAKVDVNLEVFGWKTTDDDDERVLTYTGSVSLNIIPVKDFKFLEGTVHARSLVEIVWPIARTSLVEHAQRLGTQALRIPMTMTGATLEEDEEAEADPVDATSF